MRNASLSLRFSKITSATTTIICLFCCVPQEGFSSLLPIQKIAVDMANLSKEINIEASCIENIAPYLPLYNLLPTQNISLTNSFEKLAHTIKKAPDTKEAAIQFFHSFIEQSNMQKSNDKTIENACKAIRQNMDKLSLSKEYREHLLLGLDVMQTKGITSHDELFSIISQRIYWPWDWNWFGLNKHDRHLKSAHSKIGAWEVIAFALFCCAVVLVAIFAPAVVSVVASALAAGAEIFL